MQGLFRSFGTLAQVQGEKGEDESYYVDVNIDLKALILQLFNEDQDDIVTKDKAEVVKKLHDWEANLRAVRNQDRPLNFADELKPFGLLDKFNIKLDAGQSISIKNVLRELLMQDTMAAIMNDI